MKIVGAVQVFKSDCLAFSACPGRLPLQAHTQAEKAHGAPRNRRIAEGAGAQKSVSVRSERESEACAGWFRL